MSVRTAVVQARVGPRARARQAPALTKMTPKICGAQCLNDLLANALPRRRRSWIAKRKGILIGEGRFTKVEGAIASSISKQGFVGAKILRCVSLR